MRSALQRGTIGALAALGCTVCLLNASADSPGPAALITASEGEASVGPDGSLAEGQSFETGSDGKCAMLVDGNAAVEACGDTALRFETSPSGARVVQMDKGRIRIVVEPRDDTARIEIHTQAAIATLLGTIAYVEVDPETQETTVTSAESRVKVTSSQSDVSGKTILDPGEQITVRRGQSPPVDKRSVDLAEMAKSQCSFDYRRLALDSDRERVRLWVTERATEADTERALRALGDGSSRFPASIAPDTGTAESLESPEDVCAGAACVPLVEPNLDTVQSVQQSLP